MLGLLITIVGLVVGRGRGMVGRGMVDDWGRGISWGMMDSMVDNRGMVDDWGMVDSMVGNNRGSMNCMMNRGSMMDRVSTESCEWNSWPTSHKGDKSNQSKDLHDVAM